MQKSQLILLVGGILLFFTLYFGCDTKAHEQKLVEKARAVEAIDIEATIMQATAALGATQRADMEVLERKLLEDEKNVSDTTQSKVLKDISGAWYRLERADIAGHYAERVANLEKTEQAWSIVGTTFIQGLMQAKDEKIREYCASHAIKALENAISLNPTNPIHKVNLALCYAENPPKDNPMKAVLMLRELEQQYPNNASVQVTLGRLAIKTGQYDRAIQRLEKAKGLDTQNRGIDCLLANAYEGKGDAAKAAQYAKQCNNK